MIGRMGNWRSRLLPAQVANGIKATLGKVWQLRKKLHISLLPLQILHQGTYLREMKTLVPQKFAEMLLRSIAHDRQKRAWQMSIN